MTDIPRILGRRYEIGDLIGRGGMAQVHLGYDTRLSRTVAIKILRTDLAADPMFLARFRREAQSAAALNHPSIVAVYDTGEEDVLTATGVKISLPYIVMEYVKGRTVASLLTSGEPLPISEAVQVASGVLSALEYSHHEGIIHRDIKPGNVMLTPDGKVKVMDFGIARAIADSQATMTQTNSVVGTAQYLSPEQARGEVVDARSDLYSTGCLLYELLTGKPPFTGDSAVSVAYQHVSEAPTPAAEVYSDIPESIDRVVMKSLAKAREARYQSAAEFRADLLAAARGENVQAPAVTQVVSQQTMVAPAAPRVAATRVTPPPAAPTTVVTSTALPAVQEDKKKRRSWIPILLGILFITAGVALAVHYLGGSGGNATPTPSPSTTTATPASVDVPELSGLNESAVKASLEAANLVYVRGTDVQSDSVTEGEFVSSDPAPGTSVQEGTSITVHFSSSPASVQVPDVTGKSVDAARSALEAVGLKVGDVTTVNTANVAKDTVAETSPTVGESVTSGSSVSLLIASGVVDIPDVTGKTQDDAVAALNKLDLNVQINRVAVTSEAEDGVVQAQSPTTGNTAAINSTVTLDVGSFAPAVTPSTEAPSATPSESASATPSATATK